MFFFETAATITLRLGFGFKSWARSYDYQTRTRVSEGLSEMVFAKRRD